MNDTPKPNKFSAAIKSANKKIEHTNVTNEDNSPLLNEVLGEIIADKKTIISSFSLSIEVVNEIDRITKERKMSKSKLVDSILKKVLFGKV